jgi:hypothetical protein
MSIISVEINVIRLPADFAKRQCERAIKIEKAG